MHIVDSLGAELAWRIHEVECHEHVVYVVRG